MPAFTTVLGLYKPGGGASGAITPDEPVDVDKINDNFDRLDSAVGFGSWTTSTRPIKPFPGQSGFNSTLDIFERWTGSGWSVILPSYLQASKLASTYATQSQLSGGMLDGRYYTQSALLNNGVLDGLYPRKGVSGSISQTMLPFRCAGGKVTVNPAGSSAPYTVTTKIAFPTGRFNAVPEILLGVYSSDPLFSQASYDNPTSTGFDLFFKRNNNVNTTISWFAYDSINS